MRDSTVDKKVKKRKFSLYGLNRRMQSSTYTRKPQLRRALKKDGIHEGIITCPKCDMPSNGQNRFIEHVREAHPVELWEEFSDDESKERQEIPWEGFSSEESPPRSKRVDNGKGRALD
jgi:uncharacterized C2H2 Zn-finger protein